MQSFYLLNFSKIHYINMKKSFLNKLIKILNIDLSNNIKCNQLHIFKNN